jgi:hypothetical protein
MIVITYQFSSNNMPVLCISLKMRILHQIIVFQNRFPIFIVFSVSRWFTNVLLNCNLMTIKVLKYQIAEICSFTIFSEFYFNVIVAWPLWFSTLLIWNVAISLNDIEFVFFTLIILATSNLWKTSKTSH